MSGQIKFLTDNLHYIRALLLWCISDSWNVTYHNLNLCARLLFFVHLGCATVAGQ